MGILLAILGAAGRILLGILIAVLVLIALLLFFPFSWRADLLKDKEKMSVNARVYWLLHFLRIDAAFDSAEKERSLKYDIRIAGISVLPLAERFFGRKKKSGRDRKGQERTIRKEAAKKPTVPPGKRISDTECEKAKEPEIEVIRARRTPLTHRIAAQIAACIGKLKSLIRKIRSGSDLAADWFSYLSSESFGRAKDVLFREGTAILRHILPGKISGTLCFGTDDPGTTGMILGLFSVLYPVIPETLKIEPVFTEACLEADLNLKGHLIMIVPAVHVIRILLCRDVRILISRIRNINKKDKSLNGTGTTRKGRGRKWLKTKKTIHFRTT